jgi:ribonucleoside-diphosphate reductase beta chain
MLLDKRLIYSPFEYPEFYDYFIRQHQSHWIPNEVSMSGDVQDWNFNLTESEKHLVGSTLKGFVQSEVLIEDYWSNKVANWFKKPEIQMMANTFAAFEGIHAAGYAYLQDTLGLDNYDAFLSEPTAKAKIDRLLNVKKTKAPNEIAKSLAIFSAFTEGVSLFSAFAILFNFSRFNKLKGISQIISWSVRDESLHSEAGCSLFRHLAKEYPEIINDDFKESIYEAARITVELEDNFIDKAFEMGDVDGLAPHDLKQFIRYRCNTKLQDIGLGKNWKNIDKEALDRMSWFGALTTGTSQGDFFAVRISEYSKGNVNFDNMW